MIDISRHKELFNPSEFSHPINVIGAGATGSWLTLCLAKLGLTNIKVWDFDVVEEHNIANQAFRTLCYRHDPNGPDRTGRMRYICERTDTPLVPRTDVGQFKVSALYDVVQQFTGYGIDNKNIKVTGEQRLDGVVFMLTDTMSSRKEIFQKAVKFKPNVKLLIETRMGLDECRIYTVNPCNLEEVKRYEATLYDDVETVVSACGNSQSVITTAMSVAAQAVRQMINWHNGCEIQQEVMYDYINNATLTTRW